MFRGKFREFDERIRTCKCKAGVVDMVVVVVVIAVVVVMLVRY